jgi:predicted 3-demethylubiquinone-9 3-methyltransferase (glyoxalase superfamily)
MPEITPFLWLDGQAEEAARFYASIFEDASIGRITRSATPAPRG